MRWNRDIITTVFGGESDPNQSAYEPRPITDSELGVALPDRFEGERPRVLVWNPENDKEVVCNIVDVGPWNTDDPYWRTGSRPQAESGTDMSGRQTNGAGIDLTPGAARTLGIEGKGLVDWRFVEETMTSIVISSGHGLKVRGASGSPVPPQLDEVNEARKVVEAVATAMRRRGATVITFHDDISEDQSENLRRITDWHNDHNRDLDISVHFNAFDHSAHGTEVLYVTQEELAAKVSRAIADAGGFTDRGAKYRSDLYVLNNTEEPAILIETCFCDNTNDSNLYRQHFDAICEAIAQAVVGGEVTAPPPKPTPPTEEPARVEIEIDVVGDVVVTVNGQRITVEAAAKP
jgi:N-acetylmuramoyl-L-alanine amidase